MWDRGQSFLDPVPLEELLVYAFVLRDDVVQLAACRDPEHRALLVLLGPEFEDRRDETLDLPC
jgi:hypothetical protein